MVLITNFVALTFAALIQIVSSQNLPSPLTIINPIDGLTNHVARSSGAIDVELYEAVGKLTPALVFNQTSFKADQNVSACVTSLLQIAKELTGSKSVHSLQILDSWGKLESGILKGNLIWLGRFHECLDASRENISTQYCSAHFGKTGASAYQLGETGLSLGNCFPADCSSSNITDLFDAAIKETGYNMKTIVTCPKQFGGVQFQDVIAPLIFVLIVLAATLYEYIHSIRVEMWSKDPDQEVLYTDALNTTQYKTGKLHTFILAFSAIENTKRLLNTDQRDGDIHCLHGMRFISMSWVILGHSFLFVAYFTDNLVYPANYLGNHLEFQGIVNGTFSVDSFFFISGLLATYLGLRQLGKTNGKFNVPLMYLLRYIRLTPAYAFCMLLSVTLWPKFGSGPIWPGLVNPLVEECRKYWWSSLLYINNLYPSIMNSECYPWGWYLANDTQFYILLPIFLYLLYRSPVTGMIVTNIVIFASITITGVFSSITKQQPQIVSIGQLAGFVSNPQHSTLSLGNSTDPKVYSTYISDLYTKPWCRIGAYLVGVLTGYILQTKQVKIKMPLVAAALGWLCAAALNLSIIYGLYPTVSHGGALTVNTAAFYNAMARPMWCVGLAWVVIACSNGRGGPVNTFLSWKGFIPLSRLTYCAYLLHPLIIWWFFGSQEVMVHYSIPYVLSLFLAALVLANLLAYAVHLLVEAPVIMITKTLTGKIQTKPVSTNHLQFDNNSVNFDGQSTA
uniref:Nose resistant to fluoxetine protein 6-like n=1 Tax=Phallusia mammillata TaxID=59560 RepID=A0A6F9DM93_9ASCI|nr:nose resistant to fluoxetine protein 6-like [Phallusia mammillata]